MKSLLGAILLSICSLASAQQAVILYGTNEQDKQIRFQHVYDVKFADRFRIAGVNNLDGNDGITRYQFKPRLSVDVVQEKTFQLEIVYQKEWFWNEFTVDTRRGPITREVQFDSDRIGFGVRNQWKNVRNELIYYVQDSTTGGDRVEDILTVRLPHGFAVNNQYWKDLETRVQFNQVSLLYAVNKRVNLVAQYNTITDRPNVTRAGLWISF